MSGAILFDSFATAKLNERPYRDTFEQMPGGAAYVKRLERLQRRNLQSLDTKVEGDMMEFFRRAGMEAELLARLEDLFERVRKDPSQLEQLGHWTMQLQMTHDLIRAPALIEARHNAAIEASSKHLDRCLYDGDFPGAASTWAAQPELKCFVTPLGLKWLNRCESLEEALLTRMVGLFDAQICMLAKVDAELLANADPRFLRLNDMLGPGGVVHSGAIYLRWVMSCVKAQTLAELLELANKGTKAGMDPLDITTLKRWSCGQSFPSEAKVIQLSSALRQALAAKETCPTGHEEDHYTVFWLARRLDRQARMMKWLARPKELFILEGTRYGFLDLFEATSVDDWLRSRAKHWSGLLAQA
ncbi:hypothetical protein [Paucibacter sp. DJ2R-2]|uniref:hypothetical protein n=1 Tax=Paucibacter sp. DJ2R-2 TaxID=2893558 RepID=UPI0021E4F5CE|nr:hypothetical protein [Paucibacter sp. DJ2R-2]